MKPKRAKKRTARAPRPVAVGLCRCSTDRQDRSITEQESAIRAWAKERGARLLHVYKDEGISGLELSRPGLNACLEFLARSEDKGTVVLWARDRLVRPEDPIDGLVMERQIRYAGWELCYLTGSNATGHPLVDAILGLVEHHASGEYLRKLARDSLRNLLGRLKGGDYHGGKIPYGYAKQILDEAGKLVRTVPRTKKHRKTASESTRLVLGDPTEVETVRWIFREYLRGWSSPPDLADELERRGAPRPTALRWRGSSVREILVNPVYVGDVIWNRETSARCVRWLDGALSTNLAVHSSQRGGRRIAWARNDPKDHVVLRDRHEPIVPRDDFARVQFVMSERRTRSERSLLATRRSFPLGGLLFCGKCRRGMFSRTVQVKGRRYRYYFCRARSHSCRARAELVERGALFELRQRSPSNDAERRAQLENLEAALDADNRGCAQRIFQSLIERVSLRVAGPRRSQQRHRVTLTLTTDR